MALSESKLKIKQLCKKACMRLIFKQIPSNRWNPGVTSLKSLEYYLNSSNYSGDEAPNCLNRKPELNLTELVILLADGEVMVHFYFFLICREQALCKLMLSLGMALRGLEEKNLLVLCKHYETGRGKTHPLKEYSSSSRCKQSERSIATRQNVIVHSTSPLHCLHYHQYSFI